MKFYTLVLFLLSACGNGAVIASGVCSSSSNSIVNGTDTPTLEVSDYSAIANLSKSPDHINHCSATIIDYQTAVTAKHCRMRAGDFLCVEENTKCFKIVKVISHDQHDVSLLKFGEDFDDYEITPFLVLGDTLKEGDEVEIAGYGNTNSADHNTLKFVNNTVSVMFDDFINIDGESLRGACFGDSGGPLFVERGGVAILAGVLHGGNASCVDRDQYTRVDILLGWLVEHTAIEVVKVSNEEGCQ